MGRYYAGRYRSDAWWADGGANDEGYHYKYCYSCGQKTEHDLNNCISCGDRVSRRRAQVRSVAVGNYTVKIYPNGKKYCNCKGFKFRKSCKHTGMV